MTDDDLLKAGLSPREYMAARIIATDISRQVEIVLDDMAEMLQCSRATASRTMSSLVDKGILVRVSRFIYEMPLVAPMQRSDSPVAPMQPGSLSGVYQETSRLCSVEDPKGSSTPERAALNVEMEGVNILRSYDDGDDLGGVGMTEPRPVKKATKTRKQTLKYHRLTPREQWDTTFVAKEFRHRMTLEYPQFREVGVDSKKFVIALNLMALNYEISVQTMITALDDFFGKGKPAHMPLDAIPYKVYLAYLMDRTRDIERSTITPEQAEGIDREWEELLNGAE